MKKLNLLLIGLAINLLLVVSCDKKMPTGVEPTKKLSKTSPAVVGEASTLSENIPGAISPMTVPPAVTADPFASDFLAPLVGQSIVVPNSLEFIEGNTNNAFPFNIALFGLPSMRYQQVFDASQFGALSGPELITQIAFRPDGQFGVPFLATLANIQIDLSTTAAGPDGLNSIFANNVGLDNQTVYSGPLTLSSSGTALGFDIIINLQTPFLYDPSLGNLLLDVRNFSGVTSTTTAFDLENTINDPVSRLQSSPVGSSSGSTDTGGLITQFTTLPPVDITVTLSVPVPIIVPAGGSIFDMTVTVDNNTSSTLNAQVWNTVTLVSRGGEEVGPVGGLEVTNISVPAFGQFSATISNFEFPGGVPPGSYLFNWKVGTFPNVELDRDSFGFSKAVGPSLNKAGDDDWGLIPTKESDR